MSEVRNDLEGPLLVCSIRKETNVRKRQSDTDGFVTHFASKGFETFPNSRQLKTPPGLRTRYASLSTLSTCVQLRIPKAIVYRSLLLSGIVFRSSALPRVNDICGPVEARIIPSESFAVTGTVKRKSATNHRGTSSARNASFPPPACQG